VHYVDGIAHIDEFELNMDMAEEWRTRRERNEGHASMAAVRKGQAAEASSTSAGSFDCASR